MPERQGDGRAGSGAMAHDTTWWLSFVGDDGFRGVVIVDAPNMVAACQKAHALGINPGGEVDGYDMACGPDGMAEARRLGRDRLIGPEELRRRAYRNVRELGT